MNEKGPPFATLPLDDAYLQAVRPTLDAVQETLNIQLEPIETFATQYSVLSHVTRCKTTDGKTLILKRPRDEATYDINEMDVDHSSYRFRNDAANTALLSDLSFVPRYCGGDYKAGFFLQQDLGDDLALVQALWGGDPEVAENALVEFARCMGEMHAQSMGRYDKWAILRQQHNLDTDNLSAREAQHILSKISELDKSVADLGFKLTEKVKNEINGICCALENPDSFFTFIHRDLIPPNVIRHDSQWYLFDFEWSGFGHALVDLSQIRMAFPTYGRAHRLPTVVTERVEETYRAVLNIDADTFSRASVTACAFWILKQLTDGLSRAFDTTHKDFDRSSQRLTTRLKAFIDTPQSSRHLPELHNLSLRLFERLSEIRPPKTCFLPNFPAFHF